MVKLFSRWIAVMLVSFMAASAIALPSNPQKNVDYQMLKVPQPTHSGDKVEVIEFFGLFLSTLLCVRYGPDELGQKA